MQTAHAVQEVPVPPAEAQADEHEELDGAGIHMEAIEMEIENLVGDQGCNPADRVACQKFQTEIDGVLVVSSTAERPTGVATTNEGRPVRRRQKRCVHRGSRKCRNRARRGSPSGGSSGPSGGDRGGPAGALSPPNIRNLVLICYEQCIISNNLLLKNNFSIVWPSPTCFNSTWPP